MIDIRQGLFAEIEGLDLICEGKIKLGIAFIEEGLESIIEGFEDIEDALEPKNNNNGIIRFNLHNNGRNHNCNCNGGCNCR